MLLFKRRDRGAKKKGLSKKKFLISMIEDGEIRVRQMLQKIFDQLLDLKAR